MFRFSPGQWLLLAFGFALILLSLFLNRVTDLWDAIMRDDTVVWNQLTIAPGKHARISALDKATLVVRSSSHSGARLTLFVREDDGSGPADLVKDLCARDSCIYLPLEDPRRNGAIADYRSGAPLRIVLMHPANRGVWLEYKGPIEEFEKFAGLIDSVVTQLHAPAPKPGDS